MTSYNFSVTLADTTVYRSSLNCPGMPSLMMFLVSLFTAYPTAAKVLAIESSSGRVVAIITP